MAGQSDVSERGRVSLRNLSKAYRGTKVVDDVNIAIESGEFFTILGPSGSGKTTTMMMIGGLTYPTAGTIEIGGVPVSRLPPQARGLGVVFQNYAVFPHLTVYENVAFPLRVRRTSSSDIRRSVGAMLELVHLAGYRDRMPRELSGGQQQRVALARALVFNPPVLLMDEPLSALDKKLREHMQTEIRSIHKRVGVTVIYVTHDQHEALTMSDRIAIMNNGRVEQIGSPKVLYEAPDTLFIADFLGESNFINGVVVDTDATSAKVRTSEGLEFAGRPVVTLEKGATVTAAIRPERLRPASQPGDACNAWEGLVEDIVYAGEAIRYRVRINDSVVLTMRLSSGGEQPELSKHSAVKMSWNEAEMRIFPRASNAG
jgi:putative spermidine/putrescine transport system ATP-binding protein